MRKIIFILFFIINFSLFASGTTVQKEISANVEAIEVYDGEITISNGLLHSKKGFEYKFKDGILKINSASSNKSGNNSQIVQSSNNGNSVSIVNGIKYSTVGEDIYIDGEIKGNIYLNGKLLQQGKKAKPKKKSLVTSIKIKNFSVKSIHLLGESSLQIGKGFKNQFFQQDVYIDLSVQSKLSFSDFTFNSVTLDLSGQSALDAKRLKANKTVVNTLNQSEVTLTECVSNEGIFESYGQSSILMFNSRFQKVSKDSFDQSEISFQ